MFDNKAHTIFFPVTDQQIAQAGSFEDLVDQVDVLLRNPHRGVLEIAVYNRPARIGVQYHVDQVSTDEIKQWLKEEGLVEG